jgi:hypothetical protein
LSGVETVKLPARSPNLNGSENRELKEVVAEITLKNRVLKKV